jgi:histidinol-phosphate aminotransferase
MSIAEQLIRKNIAELIPYSSAREEYSGEDAIFFDANENPYDSGANRYPDPFQKKVKQKVSQLKHIPPECIFLGNGSDEPIDLLIRAFCEPGFDNIISIKPTYGMYKVCAGINNVEFREVLLNSNFQIDIEKMLNMMDRNSKLLFLCSPNNPTSNSINHTDIFYLLENFTGLVIVDEAYIDFSSQVSLLPYLGKYQNLVILQTFSKAWGMAGVRMGMAFAAREIIQILNRIKYPYNVSILTQKFVLERLSEVKKKDQWVKMILEQREILRMKLNELKYVENILPSDSNFLMVMFQNPGLVFKYLIGKKIIIRDRSKVPLCEGYLRITVGTEEENKILLDALWDFTM